MVKQTTSTTLCKVYLVSVPHYILRHSIRHCDCLSVSEVEDYKHITITNVMGVRINTLGNIAGVTTPLPKHGHETRLHNSTLPKRVEQIGWTHFSL